MMQRHVTALSTLLLVAACATPYDAKRPKIGELSKRPPPIADSTILKPIQPSGLEENEPQAVEKAIENYREILKLSPDDPVVRAEAQRRLADLQIEVSEMNPEAESEGKVSTKSSVRLYEKLLEEDPDNPQNDRIYYQKARAHQNRGELEQAIEALAEMARRFPQSGLVGDAQFRRAELLFSIRRYADAEAGYGQVMALGELTPYFERAQYKYGWAIFKQERYADSMDTFLAILDRELPVGAVENLEATLDVVPRAQRELVRDVLRVVSLSFSYLGGGQAITEYLSGRPERSYEPVLYANLAELFIEKNRYSDAARSYSGLADRSPTHPLAPLFQAEVINVYDRAGFPDLVLKSKIDYVNRYDLDQTYWTKHDKADSPEAFELLRSNMEQVASHWHAGAQKATQPARKRELYTAAADWYARYLDRFPDEDNIPQINFLYAESLFESGRYALAADQYERTAYDYGDHAQAAEAGYAAVLSRHKLQTDARGEPDSKGIEASVATSLRFADTFNSHGQVASVLTRAAEDLYRIGELERTIEIAERVVKRQPQPAVELRLSAWSLIGFSNLDLERYAAAETGFSQSLALVPQGSPQRAEFSQALATSIYKQGELAQAEERLEDAIAHFLRIKKAVPGSEIAATGDFDAAAVLIRMEQWDRAAQVLQGFRRDYPKHPLQSEVTRKLAGVYLKNNQPVLAAGEFQRIAANPAEPEPVRREASWQAATLFDEAGELVLADGAYEQHVKLFPRPFSQAFIAYEKLIAFSLERGDITKNRYWMRELIKADRAAGAESTERSRYMAAKSAMVLARDAQQRFMSIELKLPLNRSLRDKRAAMDSALGAYRDAAYYGLAEFATEATYQIGSLYYRLSRELIKSERPRGLSALELEQYELLLEEQAFPLEEQAIEVHVLNLGRIAEGVYDDWVRKSLAELGQIQPGRFAKPERSEVAIETLL